MVEMTKNSREPKNPGCLKCKFHLRRGRGPSCWEGTEKHDECIHEKNSKTVIDAVYGVWKQPVRCESINKNLQCEFYEEKRSLLSKIFKKD